jgi:AraC-like DNA-binding protein
MVKNGQWRSRMPMVPFAASSPLGVEVLTLSSLRHRMKSRGPGRLHRTDFHHLLLVAKGQGTHVVDFERYKIDPGMVVYVRPGQVHRFGHEPQLDASMVVFRPETLSEEVALAPCGRPGADRLALATALVDGLAQECAVSQGGTRSRALLGALVQTLMYALDDGAERPERAGLFGSFLVAVEREFRRAREVAAYAAILGCSTRTLTRHCLEAEGKSAKRVIDDRILLEARRFLAHESVTVAALASQLGFPEPTQFVKFFRRVSRETPGQFRKRILRGEAHGREAAVPLGEPGRSSASVGK